MSLKKLRSMSLASSSFESWTITAQLPSFSAEVILESRLWNTSWKIITPTQAFFSMSSFTSQIKNWQMSISKLRGILCTFSGFTNSIIFLREVDLMIQSLACAQNRMNWRRIVITNQQTVIEKAISPIPVPCKILSNEITAYQSLASAIFFVNCS